MPGVVVTTAVRTGPIAETVGSSSTFFVAGLTERGSTTESIQVTSIADFEDKFGGYVSYGYVHPALQTFFEEGGSRAYVSRIVGASATAGSLTLADDSAVPAITLTAVGAGDWSANMTAEVIASGGGVVLKVRISDNVVYQSSVCTSNATLVGKVNSSGLAKFYFTATDEGGSIVDPVAQTPFSAGDDKRGTVTASNVVNGLANFDDSLGAGAVAIPGYAGATVWGGLISHANDNNRVALLAFEESATYDGAISDAASFSGANAEHAGFFFPWVTIQREPGVNMNISPEGYVAGKRAIAHNNVGPWEAYAGVQSRSSYVTALSQPVSKAQGDALDAGRVNAIRVINGTIRVYGARSASADEDNFRFINSQEMLNYVVVAAQAALEDLVFSTIDGRSALFSRIEAKLVGILEPLRTAGGLFEAFNPSGERIDYGYTVQVNEAINPLSQLAGGLVRAKIAMRVASVADMIEVTVTKSNLTASVA